MRVAPSWMGLKEAPSNTWEHSEKAQAMNQQKEATREWPRLEAPQESWNTCAHWTMPFLPTKGYLLSIILLKNPYTSRHHARSWKVRRKWNRHGAWHAQHAPSSRVNGPQTSEHSVATGFGGILWPMFSKKGLAHFCCKERANIYLRLYGPHSLSHTFA